MARSVSAFRVVGAGGGPRRSVLTAAVILLLSATAAATKIKGKVAGFEHLRNPVWVEAKDPTQHLYSFREPVPTVPTEHRRLYPHIPKELCVAALADAKQPKQEPILIRVGGGRTTPVTIVVTPGTQLQFQNTDPFEHHLYGVDIPDFKAMGTVKGGLRSWTVPAPGTYEIRDEAAPSLRMWVIAEDNVAAIAYPSLEGEFVVNVAEPGLYRLQSYFAGKKVGPELPVEVQQRDLDIRKAIVVAKKGDSKNDDDKD